MVREFFKWIFREELLKMETQATQIERVIQEYSRQERRISNLLKNIDVSVDVHQYSKSWAVVSIQGSKTDYIKFIDLGQAEIIDIQRYLQRFDRSKVDASPIASKFLRINN